MNAAKKELFQRLADIGLYEKTYVDEETAAAYLEGKETIPENIYREYVPESFGRFYRIEDCGLNAEERREFLLLKIYEESEATARHTQTTKNCMIFFTVLTVISLTLFFLVNAL